MRFVDLLAATRHGGSAARYHQAFAAAVPCLAARLAFDEIAHLSQVGVAVGMNFLKSKGSTRLNIENLIDSGPGELVTNKIAGSSGGM
ncbi:MAG: hypothetical protein IPG93_26065 [Burkholderiales bacterium]|nr:hypothetical protein [Burkholderiales bacterium]